MRIDCLILGDFSLRRIYMFSITKYAISYEETFSKKKSKLYIHFKHSLKIFYGV